MPKAVRLTARLACALSTMAMGVHVGAKKGIHSRLVSTPLSPEPLDYIGIHAQREKRLVWCGAKPTPDYGFGEHLRSPRWSIVVDDYFRVPQSRDALEVTCGLG